MRDKLIKYFDITIFRLLPLIIIPLILQNCISVTPTSLKTGKNYFETFYAGDEGTQYFIKPIVFKNENSKEEFILDLTFRYKNEVVDSVIVNFSINSSNMYKNIDSLIMSGNGIQRSNKYLELIYFEKTKNGFRSRYSTKYSLKEIKEIFIKDKLQVIVYNQNNISSFEPTKKSLRVINLIRDNVFVLM